ncbi:MAG: hypothetical protein KBF43_15810 [Dermatophilaceae bacterium]|nr:hypothetical protein [Actinomycetales bacterium]MBP9920046.1 hypothetical protein [Dermatophilaceae bacterium]
MRSLFTLLAPICQSSTSGFGGTAWLGLLVITLQAATLAWRRTYPIAMFVIIGLACASTAGLTTQMRFLDLALLFALYAVYAVSAYAGS